MNAIEEGKERMIECLKRSGFLNMSEEVEILEQTAKAYAVEELEKACSYVVDIYGGRYIRNRIRNRIKELRGEG